MSSFSKFLLEEHLVRYQIFVEEADEMPFNRKDISGKPLCYCRQAFTEIPIVTPSELSMSTCKST